jgi:hypothetical protein
LQGNAELQVCKEDQIIAYGLLEHDDLHTTIVPTLLIGLLLECELTVCAVSYNLPNNPRSS